MLARFDAVSFLPGSVQGIWIHRGARYEDELLRVVIDVEDVPESHQYFAGLKAILCERLQQIDIYIASYAVEII